MTNFKFHVGETVELYNDWDEQWQKGTIVSLDDTYIVFKFENGPTPRIEHLGRINKMLRHIGETGGAPDFSVDDPPAPRPDHREPLTAQIAAAQQQSGLDEPQLRAEEIVHLINEYRATKGAQPLKLEANLQLAAQTYANTVKQLGGSGHEVGGTTFTQRIEAACQEHGATPAYGMTGEICAYGYGSESAAVKGWQQSEGHNWNMLVPEYDLIGVGVSKRGEGGVNWVAVLGQTRPA